MAIESSLTQEIGGKKTQQLEYPSPESSLTQGDSDMESTSVSSSMQGSVSSATSSHDQFSSNVKQEASQKKQLKKSISKKVASFGSFMSSRRRAQSKLSQTSVKFSDDGSTSTTPTHPSSIEVSDESSNYVQKPMPRFTRTRSLRSVKIFRTNSKNRNKNRSASKQKTSSADNFSEISEESHVDRATFSSILKDSKFPEHLKQQSHPSEPEEVLPVAKVCPYQHCSLHGHHHHHEPPVKRFAYLKRRVANNPKITNPETRQTDKTFGKKRDSKVTKKVSDRKKDVDFSIEFYAKTRFEPHSGHAHAHDDAEFADMLFGVNSLEEKKNEIPVLKNRDFNDLDDEKEENSNGSKWVLEKKQSLKKKNSNGHEDAELAEKKNEIAVSKNRDFRDLNDEKEENSNGLKRVLEKKQSLKKKNRISMWGMIHQHMVSGLAAESGDTNVQKVDEEPKSENKDLDDAASQETELRKMFAIKLVRDAIEKILLPEVQDDQSTTSEVISEQDLSEKTEISSDPKDESLAPVTEQKPSKKTEKDTPSRWSHLKKVILLTKFVKELEKVKKFNPRKPRHLPVVAEAEPEPETVSLRRLAAGGKKNSDEWMLDYALQKVVSELGPTQKRKVALLVKAFETVAPPQDDPPVSGCSDEIQRVGSELKGKLQEINESCSFPDKTEGKLQEMNVSSSSPNKTEDTKHDLDKEKHMKMWHMIYQHVVTDIATRIGSDLLVSDEESTNGDEKNPQENNNQTERSYRIQFTKSDAVKLVQESVNEILLPDIPDNISDDTKLVATDISDNISQDTQSVATNTPDNISQDTQSVATDIPDNISRDTQSVATDIPDNISQDTQLVATDIPNNISRDTKSVATDVMAEPKQAPTIKPDENTEPAITRLHHQKSKNWAKLKNLILLKRSIRVLEGFRNMKTQTPQRETLISEQEDERVELRRQMMDERKKAEQWMLDYAVQHIVTKLTPSRKKRVSMLVEAFEAVVPLPEI